MHLEGWGPVAGGIRRGEDGSRHGPCLARNRGAVARGRWGYLEHIGTQAAASIAPEDGNPQEAEAAPAERSPTGRWSLASPTDPGPTAVSRGSVPLRRASAVATNPRNNG